MGRTNSLLWGVALAMSSGVVMAATTESELRNAIVNPGQVAPEDIQNLDVNEDGRVDVADLVAFMKGQGEIGLLAYFVDLQTQITEGDAPQASLAVNFSEAFNGSLNYRLTNMATGASTDHTLSVSGQSANINVPVADDLDLEPTAEVWAVTLLPADGRGYGLGVGSEHQLVIFDNDTLWRGLWTTDNGISVSILLKLLKNQSTVDGAVIADGYSIIPQNGQSSEWPLASVSLDNIDFSATTTEISLPQDASLFNVPMTRTLAFVNGKFATTGEGEQTEQLDNILTGDIIETIQSDQGSHLNRTIEGTFFLTREIPEMPALVINLIDSE